MGLAPIPLAGILLAPIALASAPAHPHMSRVMRAVVHDTQQFGGERDAQYRRHPVGTLRCVRLHAHN
jgi:hypothetical protein